MTPLAILLVALVLVVGGVLVLRFHPFIILITVAFVVAAVTPAETVARQTGRPTHPSTAVDSAAEDLLPPPGRRVAEGFGKTALDIGVVIAMASILGGCLSAAGAAGRLVEAIRSLVGPGQTPLALLLAGFVLGIPMFAETVFYLLLPLARAAWQQSGRHYLLCVLAIVAGVTMTHSLVPPTPGPLFVADSLGVDIAAMIAVGGIVGMAAALSGYLYAVWADHHLPLAPTPRVENDSSTIPAPLRKPSLLASLLPIVLPVVLISLDSVASSVPEIFPPTMLSTIRLIGEKNLALTLSALAAMMVLAGSGAGLPLIRRTLSDAVLEAGGIILVIGAGGALGATLRQAGMAELSGGLATGQGVWLIPAAWLITAVVRIAQGSATVAMITAAGVVAPMLLDSTAGCHPVYVAVAIGCGSKIGMWMNDSGFWVIARMSGMNEAQTLSTASVMVGIEGTVGLVVTLLLAWLW